MKGPLLVLGFFACFGLIFVIIIAGYVRMFFLAKNGGLEAAPKFCPHCGTATPLGGGVWYPTSPGAALRASGVRLGPFMIGGPFTKAGWTCRQCGATATKGPAR
jgi:hypothetical protein